MKLALITLLFTLAPVLESYHEVYSFITPEVTVSGKVVDVNTNAPLPGVTVLLKKSQTRTTTNIDGEFELKVPAGEHTLVFTYIGYKTISKSIKVDSKGIKDLQIKMKSEITLYDETVVAAEAELRSGVVQAKAMRSNMRGYSSAAYPHPYEEYDEISENTYKWTQKDPLSTFSIDVDGASYSNVRRMIMDGHLPPVDAVRIEEMINYFGYNYEPPVGEDPFSVNTELAPAPWNTSHQLVQIGIQGEKIKAENLPPNNLVFLLDVSGSMSSSDKLPLLKKGFRLLVSQLREEDYVSIVVYAGSSGIVLPPTSGSDKETILHALERLRSGGSTAGAAGIRQAYALAKEHFREEANNRVILATDGDFNVGVTNNAELIKLIEEKRKGGVFLSVLGFGTGNLNDSRMEKLANHGNGNYYYIDNLMEARKVLVSEMGGTLHTIAKDVKIQVEFNPNNVRAYRLIGYENRLLTDEDFNNDQKDAGELGAGHTVTALYEIIPSGVAIDSSITDVDPLKYQEPADPVRGFENEIMTVKLRYKQPDEDSSKLLKTVISKDQLRAELSEDLSFAAAVASFGMLLRDSKFKGNSSFELVDELARQGRGEDENGYRSEFIKIADLAHLLYQGQSRR